MNDIQNWWRRIRLNWQQLLVGLVLLLTAIYIVFALTAPKKKIRSLTGELELDQRTVLTTGGEISSLIREKSFLESRLELARSDSIGMVINLADSSMGLEIRGVRIHTTDINIIKHARFFGILNDIEYSQLLGSPAKITRQRANIEKEPVNLVNAPKDPEEAIDNVFAPDTTSGKAIFVTLILENGIMVLLIDKDATKIGLFIRDFGRRVSETTRNLLSVCRFKIPEYRPAIKLYLPGAEIRTIYRALPCHAEAAIKL